MLNMLAENIHEFPSVPMCKDTNGRIGNPLVCADVCSTLKVRSKSVAMHFFRNYRPGANMGQMRSSDFYYHHLPSTIFYSGFLSPVDLVCEALEVTAIYLVQILPLDIWARVFLFEAQDWVVQDEFALSEVAVVV